MAKGARADDALPDAPERPGVVTLARHGEPALSRKVRLSAAEYGRWWQSYEVGGLKADQTIPAELKALAETAGFIIASTRPRSVQTAKALSAGQIRDTDLMESLLFKGHEIATEFFLNWKRGATIATSYQSSPLWEYDATAKGNGHNMLLDCPLSRTMTTIRIKRWKRNARHRDSRHRGSTQIGYTQRLPQ